MALNLNPDDYGIVGSLDKQGMEDRLKEIREQIASFGPTAVADVKRSADPVYGAGVPAVEYVTKDPTPEPTPETPQEEARRNLLLPNLAETTKGDKIKAPKRFLKGKEGKQVGKKAIYNWYLDEGGKTNKSMNKLLRQSGVEDYDSVKDAKKFAKFLTKKLNKSDARLVNVGMDKARDAFGGTFNRSDYDAALGYEGQDKQYIKNYLQDYLGRGGNVGQNVLNIFGL